MIRHISPLLGRASSITLLALSSALIPFAAQATPLPPQDEAVVCTKHGHGLAPVISQNGDISPPPIPQGAAQFRCEGAIPYTKRPAAIQRIMLRMYGNDGTYHRLSGVFVDEAPGDPIAAVRVVIQQPNSARMTLYRGRSASGQPREIRVSQGDHLVVYNPAANVFTQQSRPQGRPHLDALAGLPLGVEQEDQSGTSFSQGNAAPGLVLADSLIHPAAFVTSPLFESSRVRLAGTATLDGRQAWVLAGTRVKTVPARVHHGNAWRAWIETRTGIVLRLVYLERGRELGWAGMQSIQIDGVGADPNAGSSLERWSLPANAVYQDPIGYGQVTTSNDPAPVAWYHQHTDVIIGLGLILILLVLRVIAGRLFSNVEEEGAKAQKERAAQSG